MATIAKFDALVHTSNEAGEWTGWIDQANIPLDVRMMLRREFPGDGWAWNIRLDRWISPENDPIDSRNHLLAYNDATMPRLVNGHVDYSAWDD